MIVGRHATLIIMDDPVAEGPKVDMRQWFDAPLGGACYCDLTVEDCIKARHPVSKQVSKSP